jgi:uncharacterized protein YecT (DUF1311 family)
MEPVRGSDVQRSVRIPNWTTLALIAAVIVLIAVIAYLATTRNAEQDKLTHNEVAQSEPPQAKAPPAERLCATKQTYDLIKRELFRRAAQMRGSDQAAFDQLSGYAVIRVESPVMESENSSTGAVNCSGSVSLDLPPGVAVVGGHHTLRSDVDYTVQPAADGSGNAVVLRNAEAIISPLATLLRVNEAAPQPKETATEKNETEANVAASESARKEVGPKTFYPGRPSFDCSKARSRGELGVCSDTGLAALDVNMVTQYRTAYSAASPQQQGLLRQTAKRFIAYRDRCPDTHCLAEAYLGRMQEIRDIMEGRWRPRR